MSTEAEPSKTSVEELAERFRGQMIPLTNKFSYFSAIPMAEEDLKQYLNDPIAALSPAVVQLLPKVGIILAPYLEKGNGKEGDSVTFERPAESRQIPHSRRETADISVVAMGIKDIEVADYHYQLYNVLAEMVSERWTQEIQDRFYRALREELSAEVHGEVDEKSWHLKQALLRRQTNVRARNQAVLRVRPPSLRGHPDAVSPRHLLRHRRGDRPAPDAQPLPEPPSGNPDLALPASRGLRGSARAVEIAIGRGRFGFHRRQDKVDLARGNAPPDRVNWVALARRPSIHELVSAFSPGFHDPLRAVGAARTAPSRQSPEIGLGHPSQKESRAVEQAL